MTVRTSDITHPTAATAQVTLHPTAHFDFAQSLQFVKDSGATNHLDEISADFKTLERPLDVGKAAYWLTLTSASGDLTLTLRPADDMPAPDAAAIAHAVEWANRRFFLDVDMEAVRKTLAGDQYGDEIVSRFFPARPANYASPWEALLKSVVHVQIYESFARQLDSFLYESYGTRVTFDGQPYYFVPTPQELLHANPDDLREARFSRQKAEFLTTIPRQVLDEPDKFDFDAMRERDPDEVVKTLKELHGVGDWVAQNVTMRGLPHLDAFMDEKATRSALKAYYGKEDKITKKQLQTAVQRFSPYRSIACYYTFMKHFNMQA